MKRDLTFTAYRIFTRGSPHTGEDGYVIFSPQGGIPLFAGAAKRYAIREIISRCAYFTVALYRNVTTCALVHVALGENADALVPLVTLFSTAHRTALKK